MSTPLRDAFPMAMQAAQANQGQLPDPPMPGGNVPHGPIGGQAAGSMNNQLPPGIQQMTGREDISPGTRAVQTPMPAHGPMPGQAAEFSSGPSFQPSQQQVAQAAAYQEAVRQHQMERARADAEGRMRSIAKEEARGPAVGYVAIGMCIVIMVLCLSAQRGGLPGLLGAAQLT